MRTLCALIAGGALALALTSCSGTEAAAEEQALVRACAELRDIAADAEDGILQLSDLPDRLPDLVRDARGTELHDAAVDALAAAERADKPGVRAAVVRMSPTCDEDQS